MEALECFEATTITIVEKMAMCEFYADIYVGFDSVLSTKLHTTLELALPKMYAAILVFSIKACQYFDAQCRVYLYVV